MCTLVFSNLYITVLLIWFTLLQQVINMEWGNFWSSHLPRTPVDEALDSETMNPGEQVVTYIFLGMVVPTWFVRYRELKNVVVYLAGF